MYRRSSTNQTRSPKTDPFCSGEETWREKNQGPNPRLYDIERETCVDDGHEDAEEMYLSISGSMCGSGRQVTEDGRQRGWRAGLQRRRWRGGFGPSASSLRLCAGTAAARCTPPAVGFRHAQPLFARAPAAGRSARRPGLAWQSTSAGAP